MRGPINREKAFTHGVRRTQDGVETFVIDCTAMKGGKRKRRKGMVEDRI